MEYFITGASGFLGRHLIRRILDLEENSVVALDLQAFPLEHEKLRFIEADIFDYSGDVEADVLVHLVGSSGVWFSEKNPTEDHKISVESLNRALEITSKNKLKKIILSSSWQVYGVGERIESLAVVPTNVYGRHKLEAENILRSYCEKVDIPYSILRMSWIYGPGMRKNPVYDLMRGDLYLDPESKLDFVYVDDVCDAFIQASTRDEWNGLSVNISSGEGVALSSIEKILKKEGLENEVKVVSGDYKDIVIVNELAGSLGWSPKTGIEEGVVKTYESFSR